MLLIKQQVVGDDTTISLTNNTLYLELQVILIKIQTITWQLTLKMQKKK